ncbi:uncharacterized protein KY384_002466 [Bacidia gigantensis]|uniref:uncharacterized protein n=1 Tax=Bacidia gigantensis TaxID=2732470 RepID=UPI001D03F530|nr:uncharacterized protein KY384_002466 [Bacidia gigantensis]KAG8532589.1 hypothetical protein KY384_002466 [Bacidia gigantensis]
MPGYPPPEAQMNGNSQPHGLPIHPHDQGGPSLAPAYHDGYQASPVTGGPPPYGGIPYGPPMGQQGLRPKKGNRATQSVAPQKMDRANQQILDQLEAQQKDLKDVKDDFKDVKEDFGSKLERIEQILFAQFPNAKAVKLREQTDSKADVQQSQKPFITPKDHKVDDASPHSSFHTSTSESSGKENLPSVERQNAIHIEHNTAAQKLFRWPSIYALLQRCKGFDFSEAFEDYVFKTELNKGPLHLYGRGQGPDNETNRSSPSSVGPSAAVASPATSANSVLSDEASDASSPASSIDLIWGHGFNPFVGDSTRESVMGGLCADNTPKLDSRTVNNLHQSYLQNMQVMHPILDENVLTKIMEQFKRRYSGPAESGSSKAAFAVPAPNANVDALRDSTGFNKPIKRKHSDQQFWGEGGTGQAPLNPKPMLERSPTTALVLLVLALGKICDSRDWLQGPIAVSRKEQTNPTGISYAGSTGTDSPPPQAIRLSPSVNPAASPAGLARNHLSPRSSVSDLPPRQKNLDIIPGLAYYAQATDILGNMTGSHDIAYVQCCILAGLYAGQLANSVESLAWIQCAARGCSILARDPSLPKLSTARQNSVRLAFYTASQLESDILAEIDLPPSGIRKLDSVPYPDGYYPDDVEISSDDQSKSLVMQFYSYQLHLRKLLDWIQLEVYPPGQGLTESARNGNIRMVFNEWLEKWQSMLPSDIKWVDDDILPRTINAARLRGKYYGALYIINRPMIHYALELEAKGELDAYMAARDGEQSSGNMGPPKSPSNGFLDDVIFSAKTAIEAAVSSTIAFDGAMDLKRLIVTNIFGTAHAQFGNMLVLSAVYKSKYLKRFIQNSRMNSTPKKHMEHLFWRTTNFLNRLKPISPTLAQDCSILHSLREVVFEGDDDDLPSNPTTSSSFG